MNFQRSRRRWSLFDSQQTIVSNFKKAIASNKLSHAYLFLGSTGTGKDYFALSLAKAFTCSHLSQDLDPCGTCLGCTQIDSFAHPDVEFVFPVTAAAFNDKAKKEEKEEATAALRSILAKKKQNPFLQAKMDKATTLLVSQIHRIIEKASFHPTQGRKRVFIISQADSMGEDAANKLLKTLEEPPPYVLFILIASEGEKILPTIRSRCQIIRFPTLSTQDVLYALKTMFPKADDASINAASRYARGNFNIALSMMQNEKGKALRHRDLAVSFLRNSVTPSLTVQLIATIEEMSKTGFSREEQMETLRAMLIFFQDAIHLFHSGASAKTIIANEDIIDTVKKFSQAFHHCDFIEASRSVENTMHAISRHANPTLSFFNLAFSLKTIFKRSID